MTSDITALDRQIVEAFTNFLSWGQRPNQPGDVVPAPRDVPPAWFAYALGYTKWCPPKGEL